MRRIKAVPVRILQKALASFLIVSAVVLGLLASGGAESDSVGIDPKQTLGQQPNTPLVSPGITRNTVEVLSYQHSNHRVRIIGPDATPPPGWEQEHLPPG